MKDLAQTIAVNIDKLTRRRFELTNITIDPEGLARRCPLDNGRPQSTTTTINTTLGTLDALPLELLHDVLLQLDLQSLTTLRAVNRYARCSIDGLHKYKTIIGHAPNVLRAALAVGAAAWISCNTLYAILCNPSCSHCRDFGAFFYLLSGERVCFLCLSDHRDFLPLTEVRARDEYGLSRKDFRELQSITTLPGMYSVRALLRRKRMSLVDRRAAQTAGIKLHGSSLEMELFVDEQRYQMTDRYEKKVEKMPWARIRKPSCPPYTVEFDEYSCNPLRFMATVRVPLIKAQTGIVQWGFSCQGCVKSDGQRRGIRQLDWRRMFSLDGYVDHVKDCPHSLETIDSLSTSDTDIHLSRPSQIAKTS
ncbi:MAG: hypothetical protein M1816_001300 [Peltula sp. TS41687]|nr:MAG: hypothetical protein M1816_001300 [Peltula sp. TS41687]